MSSITPSPAAVSSSSFCRHSDAVTHKLSGYGSGTKVGVEIIEIIVIIKMKMAMLLLITVDGDSVGDDAT